MLFVFSGISACSSQSGSAEGKLVVAAVVLSPILFSIGIVKETGQAIGMASDSAHRNARYKTGLENEDIKVLMEILSDIHGSQYIYPAAQKIVELHEKKRLDEQQLDQVLYLADSYLILSRYQDKDGLWKLDAEKIQQAWKYIKIYSEQRRLYDIEKKRWQTLGKNIDCLCDQYNILDDTDILRDIRSALYLQTMNDLNIMQRKQAFEHCEKTLPYTEELLYLDYGQVNVDSICSASANYAQWNL